MVVRTDQWSQCLRKSMIACPLFVEVRHTPVDLQWSVFFENNLFYNVRLQNFLQVLMNQLELVLPAQFCHFWMIVSSRWYS